MTDVQQEKPEEVPIVAAPKVGTKRNHSLIVKNVPDKHDKKKFMKYLNSLDISYSKTKKIFGQGVATITFENIEQKEKCKNILTGQSCDGAKNFVLEEPRQMVVVDRPKKPIPDSIEDVVTPLHKVPYEEQLIEKENEMKRILAKVTYQIKRSSNYSVPKWLAGVQKGPCCPFQGIIPSPDIEGYRNKSEFTISLSREGKPMIGFLIGSFKDGLANTADPSNCKNVSPIAIEIRNLFQKYIESSPYPPYCKVTMKGVWRLIYLRTTELKECMAVVQINPKDLSVEELNKIKQELKTLVEKENEKKPLVSSLFLQHHEGVSNMASYDSRIEKLYGVDHIFEKLFDLKFRISPTSFFQVNTKGAEKLYSLVREWCAGDLNKKTTVLDICCGTGTIGLSVAKQVDKVVGIESVEDAIKDANFNATENDITNATFVIGKAEDVLEEAIRKIPSDSPIIAIVDPPRPGLHSKALHAIRACSRIDRLIYVSCNPPAFVNDASTLCRSESNKLQGEPFRPVKAMAVDMFPHTPHCELVVLFKRLSTFDAEVTTETTAQIINEKKDTQ